ncbi:response regulator [Thermoflexus sp.]|uniref:response regulator n=1 Tax=Thermoflexus sp. TaxID=1969742 RepID=UPI0025CF7C00|nr:response regulator [Thermoflexus sp.]MDW8181334.1 response regulator [Anaerolineae bacterium]MCS6963093.1 response regulator [Thermoflexus sp.]MCS7351875.1 response regulator [Thermoflexus sp.]MCX7690106.1 response regulator [Thermoflexus sp.]MDW8185757.1 response regulator [Anaerolineae bacterium]
MARLLVVDDDPDARRLIGLVLRRAGHEILYAEDGFHALEVMSREHPDLIILDLMMPGMDGFEVLEAMRQRKDLVALPVIVLTAKTQIAPAAGQKLLNVHAYLTKPVSAETLVQTVQETLKAARPLLTPGGRALEIACGESWPGSAGEFLASALAVALAAHAPTFLIDVEGLGRGAMIFDMEPRLTTEDLEVERDPVQGLIPIQERLQVWSVYGRPSVASIQRVAERLAPQAEFLVWMVGDPATPVAASIFPRCQRIFITFESHGPGMRRARGVLRQLEELGLRSPQVQPIWVRRWAVPEPWTETEIQNRLGGVPIRVWPVDPVTAHRALQEGRSIQEIEPESPTAYRIREWAREILELAKERRLP